MVFGADTPHEEAAAWAAALAEKLPDGSEVTLKPQPLVLDLDDITEEHAGNRVRVYLGKGRGLADGILEHVYVTGGTSFGRTLIIDGRAFAVPPYSSVEVIDW